MNQGPTEPPGWDARSTSSEVELAGGSRFDYASADTVYSDGAPLGTTGITGEPGAERSPHHPEGSRGGYIKWPGPVAAHYFSGTRRSVNEDCKRIGKTLFHRLRAHPAAWASRLGIIWSAIHSGRPLLRKAEKTKRQTADLRSSCVRLRANPDLPATERLRDHGWTLQ